MISNQNLRGDRVDFVIEALEHVFDQGHLLLKQPLHIRSLLTVQHHFEILLTEKVLKQVVLLFFADIKEVAEFNVVIVLGLESSCYLVGELTCLSRFFVLLLGIFLDGQKVVDQVSQSSNAYRI